jgi:hypothetical protein
VGSERSVLMVDGGLELKEERRKKKKNERTRVKKKSY